MYHSVGIFILHILELPFLFGRTHDSLLLMRTTVLEDSPLNMTFNIECDKCSISADASDLKRSLTWAIFISKHIPDF